MAQRLEAALRRPGSPEPRPMSERPMSEPRPSAELRSISEPRATPQPALAPMEFADGEAPPPIVPEEPRSSDAAKSRSVLDSLEEEMASLLGRPPEKS
jgi:hypothetical protein